MDARCRITGTFLLAAALLLNVGCARRAGAESRGSDAVTAASNHAGGVPRRLGALTAGVSAASPAAKARKAPAKAAKTELRLEVNVARRRLYVYRGDRVIESHRVAVGTRSWPTQTGSWTINQVVFNPRWIPPREQSWAEDRAGKEPGAPDNPLGRAQLVYDAPRSIHGTNQPSSLGKAASHGSIRIANADAIHLAKLVMAEGGTGRDAAWYKRVLANRKQRVNVGIPHPIPIRVVAGRRSHSR
jgi:lipoprotein-anchoring transpeptidase ErfK/SrfK